MIWQDKDRLYSYDGDLGIKIFDNGKKVEFVLWSPSADDVSILLYSKQNHNDLIKTFSMNKAENGTWKAVVIADDEISDFRGYFYHYEIQRGGKKNIVLDPYAKSLSEWDYDHSKELNKVVTKAAIIDPSEYGPSDLNFAKIDGFKNRQDAIIYEVHVRDFTSDKNIEDELNSPFGTFDTFVERLDYIKDLGVTHIQLLPVLSCYIINELQKDRMEFYSTKGCNYNWGYDPQNYFSLSGMYSKDPKYPELRIIEFKNLAHEIHKRGMGVILDVVYNHTAKVFIFEDIEPEYYHFMNKDGSPRTSFGGGRLGTTHYMAGRILKDSIEYLVKEYKVDGFRFDMMGDHDAETISEAYDRAYNINPNILFIGEGWKTYVGDEGISAQPADQSWMKSTNKVGVFSDDYRNMLKSGFPEEGVPSFLTNAKVLISDLFENIKANPTNFEADDPGDVVQYIEAHDNLTVHDIIAMSIKKDPLIKNNENEILRRLRIGNLLLLTSQGTVFIHAGQEYGRTKHYKCDSAKEEIEENIPNTYILKDEQGNSFNYPYYVFDTYNSSDLINKFEWEKVRDSNKFFENYKTMIFTKELINIRRKTDAFSLISKHTIEENVRLISNNLDSFDNTIAYECTGSDGRIFSIFINADINARTFEIAEEFRHVFDDKLIGDIDKISIEGIDKSSDITINKDSITLKGLSAAIFCSR